MELRPVRWGGRPSATGLRSRSLAVSGAAGWMRTPSMVKRLETIAFEGSF